MSNRWSAIAMQRITTHTLTEAQIRTLRAKLANALNHERNPHIRKASCTAAEADHLIDAIRRHKPRVSDEQARKGADWLHGMVFTKRGTPRATEFAQQFTESDRQTVVDCYQAPRFELVDLFDAGDTWVALHPVYRCHGKFGSFDYIARAWQAGGNSFIEARHYG